MNVSSVPSSLDRIVEIKDLQQGIQFLERVERRLITSYGGVLERQQAYLELNERTRDMHRKLRSLKYS